MDNISEIFTIIDLAKEMKRCYLTLTQINYMSDLQSSQTQYAILRRLPDYLQEKWMEKVAIFDKFNREATYEEFLDFMEDRAAAFKTHIGQEVLRQRPIYLLWKKRFIVNKTSGVKLNCR